MSRRRRSGDDRRTTGRRTARRRRAQDKMSCGFVVGTGSRGLIEDNWEEDHGQIPSDKDWDRIIRNILRIEKDVVSWLGKYLGRARDEGYVDNNLVGTCWVDWDNRKGLELVYETSDATGGEPTDPYDYGCKWDKGVHDDVVAVVDVTVETFGLKDEDAERLKGMFR